MELHELQHRAGESLSLIGISAAKASAFPAVHRFEKWIMHHEAEHRSLTSHLVFWTDEFWHSLSDVTTDLTWIAICGLCAGMTALSYPLGLVAAYVVWRVCGLERLHAHRK